jgi:hypothetical protein
MIDPIEAANDASATRATPNATSPFIPAREARRC